MYTRKDLAVLCYVAGLFTGLVVAFASCTPPDHPNHTTTHE